MVIQRTEAHPSKQFRCYLIPLTPNQSRNHDQLQKYETFYKADYSHSRQLVDRYLVKCLIDSQGMELFICVF